MNISYNWDLRLVYSYMAQYTSLAMLSLFLQIIMLKALIKFAAFFLVYVFLVFEWLNVLNETTWNSGQSTEPRKWHFPSKYLSEQTLKQENGKQNDKTLV